MSLASQSMYRTAKEAYEQEWVGYTELTSVVEVFMMQLLYCSCNFEDVTLQLLLICVLLLLFNQSINQINQVVLFAHLQLNSRID